MKNILRLVIVLVLIVIGAFVINRADTDDMSVKPSDVVSVMPISHATMVLTWDDMVIYTDPVGGTDAFEHAPAADIVLVTDIHGDHLSVETLEAVVLGDTLLVVPQAVFTELSLPLQAAASILDNGGEVEFEGFSITAMPMYNLPESDDSRHVKGRGNGYIVEHDGMRVYVAGDTADIPEMRKLKDIDMAFVPMNLPYTMSVEDAADAVLDFKPRQVYPYHYRTPDGPSDVAKFKEIVELGNDAIEVVQLDWYPVVQDDMDAEAVGTTTADMTDATVITLTGKNFEFSTDEIRVKEGETVTIKFTSTGGFHDWRVDEFDAGTEAVNPGEQTSVTFVADKKGSFEYYCSVGNHRERGMKGILIVE